MHAMYACMQHSLYSPYYIPKQETHGHQSKIDLTCDEDMLSLSTLSSDNDVTGDDGVKQSMHLQ